MAPVYIKTDHNPNLVHVHSIANLFLAGEPYTESDKSSENSSDEIPKGGSALFAYEQSLKR